MLCKKAIKQFLVSGEQYLLPNCSFGNITAMNTSNHSMALNLVLIWYHIFLLWYPGLQSHRF